MPPSSYYSALSHRKSSVYGWWLVTLLLSLSGPLWAQNYVFKRQVGLEALGLVQFNSPAGVALDGSGNLYMVDRQIHRIVKFSPSGACWPSSAVWAAETASSTIQGGWLWMAAVTST